MTVAPRARRRDRLDVSKLPFLRERLCLLRCVRRRFEVFVTLVVFPLWKRAGSRRLRYCACRGSFTRRGVFLRGVGGGDHVLPLHVPRSEWDAILSGPDPGSGALHQLHRRWQLRRAADHLRTPGPSA